MHNHHNRYCNNPIMHTVVAGDTIWALSRTHNTTVDAILAINPGVEVYNLQIGSTLLICPGTTTTEPPLPPEPPVPPMPPTPPVKPPVACLPPIEVLRELILSNIRWIRRHFGDDHARRILMGICNEINF